MKKKIAYIGRLPWKRKKNFVLDFTKEINVRYRAKDKTWIIETKNRRIVDKLMEKYSGTKEVIEVIV